MTLYLMRHGKAVEKDEWDGEDSLRPLSEEGEGRVIQAARRLKRCDLGFGAILTSPYVRARQTAALVAEAFGAEALVSTEDRLGPGFGVEKAKEILAECEGLETLLLIGHAPDLGKVAGELCGSLPFEIKAGGLARLEIEEGHAALVWLIPPMLLA